jgi:hypothetical protein
MDRANLNTSPTGTAVIQNFDNRLHDDFACLPQAGISECGILNLQPKHDDINLIQFVIPGLTRNPVFSWIPAFAGMTSFVMINVAVYKI